MAEITIAQDLEAMHVAPDGERLYGTFHAQNWSNKPHRVLYDAIEIARNLETELTAARAQIDHARIAKLEAGIAALINSRDVPCRECVSHGVEKEDGCPECVQAFIESLEP